MARAGAGTGLSVYIVAHNGARSWGGAEKATVILLNGLQQRGHRVLLLCGSEPVRGEAERAGVPTEILKLGGDPALHQSLRLGRRLRQLSPDVFLIGTFRKMWLAAVGARLARVPIVACRIGLETDVPARGLKYRWVLQRWIDLVIVNADRIAAPYLELRELDGRVVVIRNGVRAPQRRRDAREVRRALGVPGDAPLIGTLARLTEQKRIDRLIEIVALLPEEVHCVVAGDGEERERLREHARDRGLDGRVHFIGWSDEVGDVLAALDVYVVASDREGLSSGMLEAMASCTPVLTTPLSGAEDAMSPGAEGVPPGLVTTFEPADIASAIQSLLESPARREEMGRAAASVARERFRLESMVDAYERVFSAARRSSR